MNKKQLLEALEKLYREAGLLDKDPTYISRLYDNEWNVQHILEVFYKDIQDGHLPKLMEDIAIGELSPEDFRISAGGNPPEKMLNFFEKTFQKAFELIHGEFSRADASDYIKSIYPEGYGIEELVGPAAESLSERKEERQDISDDEVRPTLQERRTPVDKSIPWVNRGISEEVEGGGLTEDKEVPEGYGDEWEEPPKPTGEIPDVLGPGGLDAFAKDVAQWESTKPEYKGHQSSGAGAVQFNGPPEPQYTLKATEGAQLMYIEETGEYFIALEADIEDTDKDVIFVYDIPSEYNLSDLVEGWSGPQDITDRAFEGLAKSPEQAEAEVRNSLSPIIISTRADFDAGFYNDDRLVTVATTISQIGELISGKATDITSGFFNARKTMASQGLYYHKLLQNNQYVAEVVAIQMLYGGTDEMSFADAEAIFTANSEIYQEIKKDVFGDDVAKADDIMAADKMKRVNRAKYDYELTEKKASIIDLAEVNNVEIPTIAVDYIADMWRKGLWNDVEVTAQFEAVTDSFYEGKIDDGLKKAIAGTDYQKITRGEDEIQTLLDTYLPSPLHASFDMKTEAGKYRNITGYRQTLIGNLKELRRSEYDMYDEDIAWSTIVSGKRRLAENILGIQLNEGSAEQEIDPILDHIIRLNDNGKAQGYLRNIGLERGYQKTEGDLMKSMMGSFGGGVVSSQAYGEST